MRHLTFITLFIAVCGNDLYSTPAYTIRGFILNVYTDDTKS